MKNKEFFKEEIFEIACNGDSVGIVNGEPVACGSITCGKCDVDMNHECEDCIKEWMEKEHEEPRIQPEVKTLKQDDRVLVSANGVDWVRRYFKGYNDKTNKVEAYIGGVTSWTTALDRDWAEWEYAKLPEGEPKSEPEIDWSNVLVDAEILVRNYEDDEWKPRHFAGSKGGDVYAWAYGCTSHTSKTLICWEYAKLAKGDK